MTNTVHSVGTLSIANCRTRIALPPLFIEQPAHDHPLVDSKMQACA